MCELLVKAIDATHSDPIKDARGCYKRGDVVCVLEDGTDWGLCRPPQFVIIKVPGVSAEKYLADFRQRHGHNLTGSATSERGETLERRRVRIDIDSFTGSTKTDMETKGVATVEATTIDAVTAVKPQRPEPVRESDALKRALIN